MRLPKKFYKKGNKYYARITDCPGHRRWVFVGCSKEEARHGLKDLQCQQISKKAERPTYRVTIKQGIEAFLDTTEQKFGKARSLERYQDIMNNFKEFLIAKYPDLVYLNELQEQHFGDYKEYRLKTKNAKPSTTNFELDTLSSMFRYFIEERNILTHNPLKKVKRLSEPERDNFYYGQDEQGLIFETAKIVSKRITWYEVFLTLFHTGMRRNELRYLTWNDIDFKQGIIKIRPKEVEPGEVFRVKNRCERVIPMTPELSLALKKLPRKSEKWVFVNSRGNVIPKNEIRDELIKICRLAKLPVKKLHKTRHSWTSLCYERGVPEPVIQSVGGWRDVNTMRRYDHSGQNKDFVKKVFIERFTNRGDKEVD